MNRSFVLVGGAVVLTCALCGRGVLGAEPPKIVAGPYLQHVTRTSQVVMWETDKPCTSIVEYGAVVPLDKRAEVKGPATIHEATLKDLEPQTVYFYRVLSRDDAGAEAASEIYSFQTAVNPDSAFAFVVMSDTQEFPDRFARIAALAYAERPNFVLHVGDEMSQGSDKGQWLSQLLIPGAELFRHVPMYVAIGNHEQNAEWFYKYHSFPDPENYYSFDYGNAHFSIIDCTKTEEVAPGGKQYQWLEADLAASKAQWKFVAHHFPAYSSDNDDYGDTSKGPSTQGNPDMRKLVPLYEMYGVDIVWTGHCHAYERTWPIREGKVNTRTGVIYMVCAGGAGNLENFAPTRTWFTAKLLRNWHYCLVVIHGGTLRMNAYDIDGHLFDYLDLKKGE